jgi:hypothetical protein
MIHPEPLRHRLHRLPLAVEHQPSQIQLTLCPLIRPREPTQHLSGERRQPRTDLLQLLRFHRDSRSHQRPDQPQQHT